MNMNKIFGILMLFAIMFSTISMAEDSLVSTNPIENQTQEHVRIMNNGLGAEIRLMQLEKSIEIKIEMGNLIVAKATELGENTTGLEALIAEMQLVLQEVQAADPTADDAVEQFVDLKSDAIELTQEFRTLAKTILPEAEQEQLRTQEKTMQQERINTAQEIKTKIRQYNQEKMEEFQNKLGIQIQETIQNMKNGTMTTEQAKAQIKTMVQNMKQSQKYGNYTGMKEEALREKVQAKEKINTTNNGSETRKQNRYQNRLQVAIQNGGAFGELIQNRLNQQIQNMCGGECDGTGTGGNSSNDGSGNSSNDSSGNGSSNGSTNGGSSQ